MQLIEAWLDGGPSEFPLAARLCITPSGTTKIKVPYLGGYEHFEQVPAASGHTPVVFRWTMRTKVAE
jgi:hypothetical protein